MVLGSGPEPGHNRRQRFVDFKGGNGAELPVEFVLHDALRGIRVGRLKGRLAVGHSRVGCVSGAVRCPPSVLVATHDGAEGERDACHFVVIEVRAFFEPGTKGTQVVRGAQ